MRGWWGAVGLLVCGCWRVNPAFVVGLAGESSGEVGGDTTGDWGMSSGSGSTGAADTTGPDGSTAGTTADEPGTTTSGPSTGTSSSSTTGTTGEPGSSTSDGSTTGVDPDEMAICQAALDGFVPIGPPLLDLHAAPCAGQWSGSDTKMPDAIVPAVCGGPALTGFALAKPMIAVEPNNMFGPSLITGTQSLQSRSGTIEGEFAAIDLTQTTHPCFLSTVACVTDQVGPCSLDIQVFVKSAGNPDWGAPIFETSIHDATIYGIALPLADFNGQPIDILFVVQNDLVGAAQEVAAWELPVISDAFP